MIVVVFMQWTVRYILTDPCADQISHTISSMIDVKPLRKEKKKVIEPLAQILPSLLDACQPTMSFLLFSAIAFSPAFYFHKSDMKLVDPCQSNTH